MHMNSSDLGPAASVGTLPGLRRQAKMILKDTATGSIQKATAEHWRTDITMMEGFLNSWTSQGASENVMP